MGGESILIVEDESVVALNVSHIVESLGYKAIGPIASGAGALKLLEEEHVDLVLMDIKLKGKMDGIELAKKINALRPLPIVFLTAYTDEQTLSRAKVTEPFGYITKSFDDGELHSTIEMALYKFKMEQKLVRDEQLLAATLGNIAEGIITTDTQGRVRYMNPAATRFLGVAFEEARGKKLGVILTVVTSDNRPISPLDIDPADNDGELPQEYTIRRRDGAELPVEWKAKRSDPEENRDVEIVHVVRDLSARIRAEVAQRRFVTLVESSDDAILTLTPEAEILSWNSGAEKIFGYSPREAVSRRLSIISPRFVPIDMVQTVALVAGGKEIDPFETVCVRKNGTTVDITVKLQGMKDYYGSIASVSLIARDVTARKNLDKKLREILNREQTRIGQNLHDSIGQMITGILFKTKAIEHALRVKELSPEADEIVDVKELLTATLLKLRELARGLIPATILSDGLVFTLRRLAQDTESLCDIRIGFTADPGVEIGDQLVSAELYHIVEEALNNAVKHSKCSEISIQLQRRPEELVISVRDDGTGLPKVRSQTGLGLKIMRHRAELIGASFEVQRTGQGTAVVCRLPIERATMVG